MRDLPTDHLIALNVLIDNVRAIAKSNSDAEVARLLGQHRQAIANWRYGRQQCPPAMQAGMAALAGFDPCDYLTAYAIEQLAGTEAGKAVQRFVDKSRGASKRKDRGA